MPSRAAMLIGAAACCCQPGWVGPAKICSRAGGGCCTVSCCQLGGSHPCSKIFWRAACGVRRLDVWWGCRRLFERVEDSGCHLWRLAVQNWQGVNP